MVPLITEYLKNVLNNLYEGAYILDTDRKILFWNRAAEEITGYKAEEVAGRHCRNNILRHTDKEGHQLCLTNCPMVKVIKEGVYVEDEVYLHHKSGYRLMVSVKGIPILKENNVVGVIELFRPILPASGVEETDLINLAMKDPLTHLYNRKGFEFIYPIRQKEMFLLNYYVGCMYFDVNNFKQINDTYGHKMGDKVLIAISKIFLNILRYSDIAVRMGGDEFLLIVFVKKKKDINTIGNKIVKIVNSSFIEYKKNIIKFSISAGGTVLKKREDISDAIERADKLMYQAKKNKKEIFISDIS